MDNSSSHNWYSQAQTLSLGSNKIFYKHEGQGEALLCIHGFPTSCWDYEPIWPELIKRFKVFTFDMLGLGKSTKPDSKITVSMQADIVDALSEKLGIREFHILAHDLGDTVAQELLARQQEGNQNYKILSCVFLNGGLFPETHYPVLSQKLLISPLGKFFVKLSSKKTFDSNMKKVFSKHSPPSETFLQESWNLLCENNGKQMLPRLIRYMEERRKSRSRWVGAIENAVIPTRLIDGVDDPVSGGHLVDRYIEVVKNPDVVRLEKTGHYPHVENPAAVLEAFFEFHEALKNGTDKLIPISPTKLDRSVYHTETT